MAEPADQRRLIAALGYAFTPIVPLVVLTSDMKQDRFMRRHAGQALIWSIGFVALLVMVVITAVVLIRADLLFICLVPFLFHLPFVPGGIWGWRVYNGGDPRPPVISSLAERVIPAR